MVITRVWSIKEGAWQTELQTTLSSVDSQLTSLNVKDHEKRSIHKCIINTKSSQGQVPFQNQAADNSCDQ